MYGLRSPLYVGPLHGRNASLGFMSVVRYPNMRVSGTLEPFFGVLEPGLWNLLYLFGPLLLLESPISAHESKSTAHFVASFEVAVSFRFAWETMPSLPVSL